jgi:hypothetical protein
MFDLERWDPLSQNFYNDTEQDSVCDKSIDSGGTWRIALNYFFSVMIQKVSPVFSYSTSESTPKSDIKDHYATTDFTLTSKLQKSFYNSITF